MAYWYHFAIMFEALFILTTIDAGHARRPVPACRSSSAASGKPFARPDWLPGVADLDRRSSCLAWGYFIWTGSIDTIWPMFGIANQLLAVVALAVGTTILINLGRAKYAWVTFVPLCFLSATTTLTAGFLSVRDNFWPQGHRSGSRAHTCRGTSNSICTAIMMVLRGGHPHLRRAPLPAAC